jgi:hypothetical protein
VKPILRSLLITTAVIATPLVGATVAVASPPGPDSHRVQASTIETNGGICGNTSGDLAFLTSALGQQC